MLDPLRCLGTMMSGSHHHSPIRPPFAAQQANRQVCPFDLNHRSKRFGALIGLILSPYPFGCSLDGCAAASMFDTAYDLLPLRIKH
jgi:hypothetical protein